MEFVRDPGASYQLAPVQSSVYQGDAFALLGRFPDAFFQCVVTSPPYWGLRDYGADGQIGAENSPEEYIEHLACVFAEVHRVLKDNGTLWVNVGDSYTSGNRAYRAPDKKNPIRAMSYRAPTPQGLKPKDLVGIPWRLAFALQQAGWYLRSDIIWEKPNCMPESVKDRPTRSHEYLFLLSKSPNYFLQFDQTNGTKSRNVRTVWSVPTEPFSGAHFATFPPKLITPCILAGSAPNDWVLDPFFGSGTVGVVCEQHIRHYVGIELNPSYVELAVQRILGTNPTLFTPDLTASK